MRAKRRIWRGVVVAATGEVSRAEVLDLGEEALLLVVVAGAAGEVSRAVPSWVLVEGRSTCSE